MTYTKEVLIQIGKTIVSTQPDLAKSIADSMQPVLQTDLTKIPDFFLKYCEEIHSTPGNHIGAVYNREHSEANKVFIAAMVLIYNDKHSLYKTISDTLKKKSQLISRQVVEIKFRYKKDMDFKTKVDNTLKILS